MNNYNFNDLGYPIYNNYNGFNPNMNILNEDRINYIPNINPNLIQFLNQNNTNDYNMWNNKNNDILEPYEGFKRGNIFSNLYDQYKNFKPKDINSNSERENMLNQWQQYNFVLTDIGLYLDTNPTDTNMFNLYKKNLEIANKIKEQYENKYGPIEICSNSILNENNWTWDDSPWPWEVK